MDLHVDLFKGGMAAYGVGENAIFMPGIASLSSGDGEKSRCWLSLSGDQQVVFVSAWTQ
jgi:hypothetical protein